MVASIVDAYGSGAQRTAYLPKLCAMDWFGSYCLTEPDSGSDAASLKTRAQRDGDPYVRNGVAQYEMLLWNVGTGREELDRL